MILVIIDLFQFLVWCKIIEKVVHKQICNYVEQSRLIYDFQSGFRKSYSTESCLLYLTDLIRKEVERGNMCGMVLLDLQKHLTR